MMLEALLKNYANGPKLLRDAVAKAPTDSLDAHPIEGMWSIREVVCHIADFEPVYADRMKRVLVEDHPTLPAGDQNEYHRRLYYAQRDIEEELQVVEATRKAMLRILRAMAIEDFQRTGLHSEDGPLTLETLLERITDHIPHHVTFIEEKLAAMS